MLIHIFGDSEITEGKHLSRRINLTVMSAALNLIDSNTKNYCTPIRVNHVFTYSCDL